jgi:hypothetical protein
MRVESRGKHRIYLYEGSWDGYVDLWPIENTGLQIYPFDHSSYWAVIQRKSDGYSLSHTIVFFNSKGWFDEWRELEENKDIEILYQRGREK